MKWLENLISLAENSVVGKCPYCGSQNTAFGYQKLTEEGYGYGAVWCNDCKKGHFIERVDISHIRNLGANIPRDVSYTD